MHQKSAHVWIAVLVSLVLCEPSYAHGFSGTGWLHPLTGLDHMLAMVAVGAWSAQLGGRAVYTVPLACPSRMGYPNWLRLARLLHVQADEYCAR